MDLNNLVSLFLPGWCSNCLPHPSTSVHICMVYSLYYETFFSVSSLVLFSLVKGKLRVGKWCQNKNLFCLPGKPSIATPFLEVWSGCICFCSPFLPLLPQPFICLDLFRVLRKGMQHVLQPRLRKRNSGHGEVSEPWRACGLGAGG